MGIRDCLITRLLAVVKWMIYKESAIATEMKCNSEYMWWGISEGGATCLCTAYTFFLYALGY